MKAQVNVVGNQRHLVSIALQKEANATKQGIVLLPNTCIKGAIKQKVLLIFNSRQEEMERHRDGSDHQTG